MIQHFERSTQNITLSVQKKAAIFGSLAFGDKKVEFGFMVCGNISQISFTFSRGIEVRVLLRGNMPDKPMQTTLTLGVLPTGSGT